ncbi:MAG: pyruvate carboxylase [Bacteroidota bacterium]
MNTHFRKFSKILVANRGEIAIRVLRAVSELHVRSVAVYSYEDRYSLHRYKADEAYLIGPNEEPLRPYLNIDEIIRVAKQTGAEAIHPGYGFLSENVAFAKRCEEEGITFIGPKSEVMAQLGDKVMAKEVAKKAQVPLIPDSKNPLNKPEDAQREAEAIGYPVILKAAAGGGGRGMRVVRDPEEINTAFQEAHGEALNAFGNGTIFLEKFIENPKHIEVQLLGDNHGSLVHLFERDCSVQRRFQKVVEIAPSNLPQLVKDQLYDYALRIGRAVNYNNAGTVEFLVDAQHNIYFIEVNPRIQVEHTITEEITGIDIVRTQIQIASGRRLEEPQILLGDQASIRCHGFAIQCRITTEDPLNNFKPDYGQIIAYRSPGGFGIRLDGGSIYPGMRISPFFDSMLVKVSSWGNTLKGACQRMDRALREFRVRGVKTNIFFLLEVMKNSTFQKGEANVGFIQSHPSLFEIRPGRDRGTKTLRYLADLVVNGNPHVKSYDPDKKFRSPKIPIQDGELPFPTGTKNQLEELGRENFLQYIKETKPIFYTDTTYRDAHQSLLATRMRTQDMMKVASAYAKAHPQIFSLEVWGGATFDVCLRFLHESPWERLAVLREAVPNILFQMLLRGSNAVGYKGYPDNLIVKFIEKAWETGVDVFRIFDSLNWIEAMKVSIHTVRERTNGIAEACICYTGDISDPSKEKYTLQYYLDLAKQLEDAGAHMLGIKDMAGLLKPYSANLLVSELKKVIDIPIHLHTHDTSSIQAATYLQAIEAGVDVVDVAISSMSGLTAQPSFNSLVAAMQGHERERPMDLDSLNEFANYWEVVRTYYYPFESELRSGTAEVYNHEIPGGQYSNLLPQARSLGLEGQFEEVKKMYAEVNQLFGDLVKVTPSSKVVGDMALFMVSNGITTQEIFDKGDQISFPNSVKNLFRGDLGQPYQGFPEKLQEIILRGESPYTDRPNAHLDPIDFEIGFKAFQQKFDSYLTELDYISWLLYPEVFEAYYAFRETYGDVGKIPTLAFFYPIRNNEEILVELEKGKSLLIEYMYKTEPNDNGTCTVFFKLNGQTRAVETRDRSQQISKNKNRKAEKPHEIGSPLQGRLSKIFVKAGDIVKKDDPLFVIEAMKMESTIASTEEGEVLAIHLTERSLVEPEDLVVELKT